MPRLVIDFDRIGGEEPLSAYNLACAAVCSTEQ